jgi:c-di-GMP-binding flagellar brake protein YcgR
MDVANAVPHISLIILLALGLILGGYSLFRWSGNPDALLVSLVLGSYNLILLVSSIFASRESIQIRDTFRLERHIPCELVFDQQRLATQTTNISDSGLGICLEWPVYLPKRVNVRLNHGGEELEISSRIVCNDLGPEKKYRVGIKFDTLSPEQEQKLIRMMYAVEGNWKVDEEVEESFVNSFTQLLVSPVNTFLKLKKMIRTQPRITVSLPCTIKVNGKKILAYTKEISGGGVCLVVPKKRLPVHTILGIQIAYKDHPLVSGEAEVVWSKSLLNKDLIGIRWAEDHPDLYETLKTVNIKKSSSETIEEKPHNAK